MDVHPQFLDRYHRFTSDSAYSGSTIPKGRGGAETGECRFSCLDDSSAGPRSAATRRHSPIGDQNVADRAAERSRLSRCR